MRGEVVDNLTPQTLFSHSWEKRSQYCYRAEENEICIYNQPFQVCDLYDWKPRSYVKKKPLPPYTVQDMEQAVFDVKNQNKTYREAEEAYRVPISVIYHLIEGRKTSIHKMGAGRLPELPEEVEKCLVKCLIARAQMGFPCDKQELKDLVQEYIQSNGIQSRFHGRPGEDWYLAFMKRNPAITLKKPEHLQKTRKKARDPFVVYQFFGSVKKDLLMTLLASEQLEKKANHFKESLMDQVEIRRQYSPVFRLVVTPYHL
ncbi:hypothetical protein GE061_001638 [Apolygus lucorum]|uniref:HTH psq-type domain-containing protein n=1 Tax=Apolygus lucorum TaxID=248454 RepID=A0A8S9Y9F0_APOLU|nr:hypothetical protein GE061_001638 [Apolygus lucorum]